VAEILRLALVGGIVGLDTAAAFQIMVCQPLVSGLLTGWALGDPWLGAFVGLLCQGLYLAEFPIGARLFPDGNQAAVQAAALAIYGQGHLGMGVGTSLLFGFLWSIPVAVIGGQAIFWTRKLNAAYLPAFDRFAETDRRGAINLLFGWIIVEDFLISAVLTVLLFLLGRSLAGSLLSIWPCESLLENWGMILRGGMLGAGCAVIFVVLVGSGRNRKIRWGMGTAAVSAVIWAAGY
jgi:mannose/fructose/N-acetylgalactosamine-specific phosphotransferase system component IIC